MNGLALYELAGSYALLAEKLYDMELDEQAIADTLEGEAGALEEKAESIAAIARNLEAAAAAIQEDERRMAKRRQAFERRADRLRTYLTDCMQMAGIKKIEGRRFSISVRKNPPSVEVYDESLLPSEFFRIPDPVMDKKKVMDLLKAGMEVPGATLKQGTRLDIK